MSKVHRQLQNENNEQVIKYPLDRKYNIKDIIRGDSIFCATGITSGDIVKGITIKDNDYISETFITHKSTKTKKIYSKRNKINQ